VQVYCNFIVYRTRLETKEDLFVGRREDLLRKENDSWKIAGRKIFLDQTVLFADNLSIFF
jgi:3-phenylpropionate/cinnamic acid dioxygenase small subunit